MWIYYLSHRQNIRVLVPGAGLARLAYDIANLGLRISHHTNPDFVQSSL